MSEPKHGCSQKISLEQIILMFPSLFQGQPAGGAAVFRQQAPGRSAGAEAGAAAPQQPGGERKPGSAAESSGQDSCHLHGCDRAAVQTRRDP